MANIRCTSCGEEKEEPAFEVRADTGKRRTHCRSCRSAANLARYHSREATRDAHRRASRRHSLKKHYGLSEHSYQDMLRKQGGTCAICGEQERLGTGLSVDHCHRTGTVRGLLCRSCNSGLGHFRDSPDTVEAAAQYLRRSRVGLVCSGH